MKSKLYYRRLYLEFSPQVDKYIEVQNRIIRHNGIHGPLKMFMESGILHHKISAIMAPIRNLSDEQTISQF